MWSNGTNGHIKYTFKVFTLEKTRSYNNPVQLYTKLYCIKLRYEKPAKILELRIFTF